MKYVLIAVEKPEEAMILSEKLLEAVPGEALKLWLLHIAEPDPHFVGFEAGPQSERDRIARERHNFRKRLDQAAEKLGSMGVSAESMMISGPVTQTLLAKGKELNAGLIVMGHRKHSVVYKAVLGSTAKAVIDQSNLPVLLIPLFN